MIIKKYDQQLYEKKLDNLDEIHNPENANY